MEKEHIPVTSLLLLLLHPTVRAPAIGRAVTPPSFPHCPLPWGLWALEPHEEIFCSPISGGDATKRTTTLVGVGIDHTWPSRLLQSCIKPKLIFYLPDKTKCPQMEDDQLSSSSIGDQNQPQAGGRILGHCCVHRVSCSGAGCSGSSHDAAEFELGIIWVAS